MNRFKRGSTTVAIASLIVLGMGVPTSFASVGSSTTSSSSTTQVTSSSGAVGGPSQAQVKLTSKDAIKIGAKLFPHIYQNLGVPQANLTRNFDGQMMYQLNWFPRGPGQTSGPRLRNRGFAFIGIDANTGQVLQFQKNQSGWSHFQASTVTSNKALLSAYDWLKKLAPNQASELVKESASGQADNGFTYMFVRKVNGVIAPFDSATIRLDNSGNLANYNFSWHEATFPSVPAASKLLSSSDAMKVYEKNLSLQLRYQRQYQRTGPGKLHLVYVPQALGNPSVLPQMTPQLDAITGKEIGVDGKPLQTTSTEKPKMLDPSGSKQWPKILKTPLTDKQVEQKVAQEFGLRSKDWTLNNSQDGTENNMLFPGQQELQLDYANQKTGMNINVNVDTSDGIILDFNQNPNMPLSSGKSSSGKPLSNTQIQTKADDFVKKLFPNLTGAIERVPQSQMIGMPQDATIRYDFVVHGVPTTGFYVNLNKATGQVTSYSLQMDPSATFPSSTGAISMQQAKQTFLKAHPPVLQYMLPETQTSKPGAGYRLHYGSTAKLVYTSNTVPYQSLVLNALTGKWISVSAFGETSQPTLPKNASSAQKAIALLEQNGIVTSDEAKAKLTSPITREEFIVWLERAYGMNISGNPSPQFPDVSKTDKYASGLSTALMQGWLPNVGQLHPLEPLTRLAAAHWIVDWMGWSGVASHSSYFKVSYSDSSVVPASDVGAATIVSDAGIIPLQSGKFNPSGQMTVGDAALAIKAAVKTYISSGQ